MSFNVSFENRVVVVIGCTSGINRGIAKTRKKWMQLLHN